MTTARPPRTRRLLDEFTASDRLTALELPQDSELPRLASAIESAMKSDNRLAVERASADFVARAADFYGVSRPSVRVLAARPLRVRESGWSTELFGDYHIQKKSIRVWMRTAVRRQVTSFGTFLSTLCHELCHHYDFERLGFHDSPHTRGFYERAAILYHHARGTPKKKLFWSRLGADRWQIDWVRTRLGC